MSCGAFEVRGIPVKKDAKSANGRHAPRAVDPAWAGWEYPGNRGRKLDPPAPLYCDNHDMKAPTRMAITAMLGTSLGSAADFSQWMDSTRVRLNTTSAGANVATDQAGFPVLVRLATGDFIFSEAKSDGSDIRFADSAGNALPFELERFDPVNKVAEVWVLPPAIKGNASTQWFKLYWGNAAATSVSSGPAVFPAAGNFAGVWHLGENGSTTAGAYKDASSYGNHGTGAAMTAASDVAGTVGTAAAFNAVSNQGILIPANASLHPTGNLTLEVWIKTTTQAQYKRYLGRPFSSVADPWNEYSLEADVTGTKVNFSISIANVQASVTCATAMTAGTWYHVVGVYDGAEQRIYVNGTLDGTVARTGTVSDFGQSLAIGKYALDNGSNFDGVVDEARVSRAARSADWIKLSYANQRPDQKLVGFERFPAAPSCQVHFATPADTAVKEGAQLDLAAQADCATGYTWMVVSGPSPHLLDPEVKILHVALPRVARDTAIVYRFTAGFGGGAQSGDVKVTVKEAIPDPLFTLPTLPTWNGKSVLVVKPTVTNAAAIQASSEPVIHYAWSVSGVSVDSAWGAGQLAFSNPAQSGSMTVGLCLDNRGAVTCKQTAVNVSVAVGVSPREAGASFAEASGDRWDAKGRMQRAKAETASSAAAKTDATHLQAIH
ncbi:MAG: hypothetical protein JWO30_614 [Fibrobacteres bacterium]|nr:hypothetical protein [Fibrobacterota bacterium]